MTPQEVLTLVNAGYTKADIEAMSAAVSEDSAHHIEEEKAAAQQPDPEQAAENADALQKVIEQNNKLLEQIRDLQKQNIDNANTEKGDNPNAVGNIIKSFIESR